MANCCRCGDSQSLRYQQGEGWVCFAGCGHSPSKPKQKKSAQRTWKRSPLFEPWWLEDGTRHRVKHTELREAYRLWAAHKDIREGRFE